MTLEKQQVGDLYGVSAQTKDNDHIVLQILIKIFEKENFQFIQLLWIGDIFSVDQILFICQYLISWGKFVRCIFNGSEFDNVDISGMNLNQSQMVSCKWKNIKIHELNILDAHEEIINQECLSPDGQSLASCSENNLIILLDVKTGKIKSRIKEKEKVKSVCFSPNNNTLIFSKGEFVYLWNLQTGKQQAKLDGHSSNVISICYSPDSTTLASGSSDKSLSVYGMSRQDNKKPNQMVIHVQLIQFVILLMEIHQHLVVGIIQSVYGIQLDGHSSTVYSVNFSPDGNTLVSGSDDHSIRLWNVQTSKEILQSNSSYKDLLAQFNTPLQNNSLLPNFNPYCTILVICQNPWLEASGTLILQGQFINYQGIDLKPLFKSKGNCFLENLQQK
ncbi:unnamed protein product [Paramecium octaurelia]|uniref:Uncharacterized protein n=1 Tax=Paramecium octaurelia TaxID=43137 RepID=A0A8S1YNE2_PAROT|nr:unnamed protein product [Paramecium octaurelia]